MTVTRREFLKTGTIVGLTATASVGAAGPGVGDILRLTGDDLTKGYPISVDARLDPLYRFTRARFLENLNTTFRFFNSVFRHVDLKLVQVKEINPLAGRAIAPESEKDCFSLTFIGPLNTPIEQGTYTVAHEQLGKFEMLVTSLGPTRFTTRYEAIINRLVQ